MIPRTHVRPPDTADAAFRSTPDAGAGCEVCCKTARLVAPRDRHRAAQLRNAMRPRGRGGLAKAEGRGASQFTIWPWELVTTAAKVPFLISHAPQLE